MPISEIEVVKPGDLDIISNSEASDDDFIIRETAADNQVLSQRVKNLLGCGPFTFVEFFLGGALPTITASTSSILNLSLNKYLGMFYDTQWYPGTNPESIVMPEGGLYLFLIKAQINNGENGGQAYAKLVFEPAGTPTVVSQAAFRTNGMSSKVTTHFHVLKEVSEGDEYGIQFTNDGLADFVVDDSQTSIFVIKIG